MSDVGTRSRPHCKLPLESERLNRASRVHGAAQTRSLAYQAAGVARFGTTKAAISTCREHRPACRSPSTREDAPLDTRACEDAGPEARAPHGGMHAGGQEGVATGGNFAAPPALRPSAPEAYISEGWGAGASQRGRTHLAHVVLHKAGHAPGSVGRMWHVTAKEQNTRVSESGWAGGKGSGAGRSPDGSALISVSARCSALAKSSSSALPRTKYVAAAAIRSRETDLVLGFYTYTYTYSSI